MTASFWQNNGASSFIIGTLIAVIFLSVAHCAVYNSDNDGNTVVRYPSTADLLMRPWVLDWRGEWMRRLSPRMGQYGWKYSNGLAPSRDGSDLLMMEKKWSRLEPSIRFL